MFVDKFLKMTYAQQGYIILMKNTEKTNKT